MRNWHQFEIEKTYVRADTVVAAERADDVEVVDHVILPKIGPRLWRHFLQVMYPPQASFLHERDENVETVSHDDVTKVTSAT